MHQKKKRLGLTNLFMVKWVVVRMSSDEWHSRSAGTHALGVKIRTVSTGWEPGFESGGMFPEGRN